MTEEHTPKTVASATVQRGELYDALRAVEPFASGDTTRPHLNGVKFEFREHDLTLIATDGHVLICVDIRSTEPNSVAQGNVLVSLDDIRTLKQALRCKKAEAGEPVQLLADNDGIQVSSGAHMLTLAGVDDNFPPWTKVVPEAREDGDTATSIGVSPAYMAQAGQAMKALGVTSCEISAITSNIEPIRIDSRTNGIDCTIIIMPMRV